VWALRFEPDDDAGMQAAALAVTTDRAHGLLVNAHFQDWRMARGGSPPWPWLGKPKRARKEEK